MKLLRIIKNSWWEKIIIFFCANSKQRRTKPSLGASENFYRFWRFWFQKISNLKFQVFQGVLGGLVKSWKSLNNESCEEEVHLENGIFHIFRSFVNARILTLMMQVMALNSRLQGVSTAIDDFLSCGSISKEWEKCQKNEIFQREIRLFSPVNITTIAKSQRRTQAMFTVAKH